tara:strand:- start:6145 stop:7611 length:1467 start_codon:yes stop_codon:yes gene_type:complete
MKLFSRCKSVLILFVSFLPMSVFATTISSPVLVADGDFDGRHYEVYAADGISWADANAAAEASTFEGVTGHLATITSAAEDLFVETLRSDAGLASPEAWVGGTTDSNCTPVPGCGWMWVNSEGPISTTQVPLSSYSNWLSGEPNDLNGEFHLGVGLNDQFGWNDEQSLGNIGGFIVEYDAAIPIDPQECTSSAGCMTTSGQMISFPESGLGNDPEVGIRTYEFTDDPARCGVSQLVLFDTDGNPDNDLIIPPYLCGSPKFLIVEVTSMNINITSGTVQIENEVTDSLPNNLYECTGPIDPNMLLSMADTLDPQHRDKVTYQRDNPADMLETDIGVSVDPMFAGSMTELTDGCASSRGKVFTTSYYGVGLSFDFGDAYDYDINPDGNRERVAALTRYKLLVLKASVQKAKDKGSIGWWTHRILRLPVVAAIKHHDRERYEAALAAVKVFHFLSNAVSYGDVADENFDGEHDARASNLEFMYTDSVIPFN